MGPEFLGAGLVFLQCFLLLLLLCASLRDPRNREDGGARNNGSKESRCHCVTPYAARIEPRLFVLNATKTSFWTCRRRQAREASTSAAGEKRAAREADRRKGIWE